LSAYDFDERYVQYEAEFDPMQHDRQARRKRKPKPVHQPKKGRGEIIAEIAETTGLEGGFQTTYQPGLFEEEWLLDSLRVFYEMDFISDVLARVRGGKEASVYRCRATSKAGVSLAAAKVYRPRKFRNLRNDALYREGRSYLKADGKAIKNNEHRLMRAIGKKTQMGEQLEHTSWLMYEYTTLQKLYQAGAAVPQPLAVGDNAILMGYCGDEFMAAPTLNTVTLDAAEAPALFDAVISNVELMLQTGLVHGDLSAYNVLYWEGQITLIDFPQVIDYHSNPSAYHILRRDITRICEYFASQGVMRDPQTITDRLWRYHIGQDVLNQVADASLFEVDEA
jgi:RIO kinase 1